MMCYDSRNKQVSRMFFFSLTLFRWSFPSIIYLKGNKILISGRLGGIVRRPYEL